MENLPPLLEMVGKGASRTREVLSLRERSRLPRALGAQVSSPLRPASGWAPHGSHFAFASLERSQPHTARASHAPPGVGRKTPRPRRQAFRSARLSSPPHVPGPEPTRGWEEPRACSLWERRKLLKVDRHDRVARPAMRPFCLHSLPSHLS